MNDGAAARGRSSGREQFVREVYPAEVREVLRRRKAALRGRGRAPAGERALASAQARAERGGAALEPDPAHGLSGLALSGGGIRSATFCLGVLQAFARRGLLPFFDYLSTVSGGGYVGAALSAMSTARDPAADGELPIVHRKGRDEGAIMRHLRGAGRYLAPGGFLDYLKIPALLLRGIAINLLSLLPFVGLLVILTRLVHPDVLAAGDGGFAWGRWYHATPWAGALLLAWIGLSPIAGARWKSTLGKRSAYERTFAVLLLVFLALLVLESLPILLNVWPRDWSLAESGAWLCAFLGAVVPVAVSILRSVTPGRITRRVKLAAVGIFGPAILLALYVGLSLVILPRGDAAIWIFACLLAAAWVFTRAFVDVNRTSLHAFYRDRLSRAFLVRERAGGGIEQADGLELHQLDVGRSGAPYPLINATLNLSGTRNSDLQGRSADFFLFSPLHTGSTATGFCATEALERLDRHLDLGTAMAISGAAAAPNAGTRTSRSLVFLLTLLDVRLDYWLPNPGGLQRLGGPLSKYRHRVGPLYLLLELFGLLDERSPRVNLSDGGHLENTGVYELLRRRCRFIVVCDAECDPERSFDALGRLTTYARMDEGITITWTGLDALAARSWNAEAGLVLNGARWAYGRIRYGGGGEGHILYLKPSLLGKESPDIVSYAKEHPDFPQESTADQFFDEIQFEAYRALGALTAKDLLGPGDAPVKDLETWMAEQARRFGVPQPSSATRRKKRPAKRKVVRRKTKARKKTAKRRKR